MTDSSKTRIDRKVSIENGLIHVVDTPVPLASQAPPVKKGKENVSGGEPSREGPFLKIKCDNCDNWLKEPGGLMFGPPNQEGYSEKIHLCLTCWGNVNFAAAAAASLKAESDKLDKLMHKAIAEAVEARASLEKERARAEKLATALERIIEAAKGPQPLENKPRWISRELLEDMAGSALREHREEK